MNENKMELTIGNIKLNQALLLAPMDDISDSPFRRMCKYFGADIVYSEFVSSEGLIRDAQKSVRKMHFYPEERPIAIQIFGHSVESMSIAAQRAEEFEPDFIDINAGCPVKKLVNKGACAALLRDLPLFERMVRAVVNSTRLPVTVKMRTGWDRNSLVIPQAIPMLSDQGVSAITIHGRTRDQAYKGVADWDLIRRAVEASEIPMIGNGDIRSGADARKRFHDIPELAAVMVGRGAIGRPWIFKQMREYLTEGSCEENPSIFKRIEWLKLHLSFAVEERGERLGVVTMRKHIGGYLRGEAMAAKVRQDIMQHEKLEKVFMVLDEYRDWLEQKQETLPKEAGLASEKGFDLETRENASHFALSGMPGNEK